MHIGHPLTPPAIVSLITRILEQPWPATVAERDEFFEALHLATPDRINDSSPIDDSDARTVMGWSSFGASSHDLLWSAFDDELLSVAIFAWHSRVAADLEARHAYDELGLLLGDSLGQATEIANGTASLEWRRGQLTIGISLYDTRDSVVQIDVTHAARGTAHEAYARERERNDPTSLAHPRRVLHLAHRADWDASRESGEYRVSTRGSTFDEVGFIHASNLEQLVAVAELFYADDPEPLAILALDAQAIRDSGIVIRYEDGGNGQLYPHIYGAILREFVTDVYSAHMDGGRFVFGD